MFDFMKNCIISKLVLQFSSALYFDEREFSFFHKITEISGLIRYFMYINLIIVSTYFCAVQYINYLMFIVDSSHRPYPKPERKKVCLDALKVIELEPGTVNVKFILCIRTYVHTYVYMYVYAYKHTYKCIT